VNTPNTNRGEPPWIPDATIHIGSPARVHQNVDDWIHRAIAAWDIDSWFQREILGGSDRGLRVIVWVNKEPLGRPFLEVAATHQAICDKIVAWLSNQPALDEIFLPQIIKTSILPREEAVALGWSALDLEAAAAQPV
jgi:hypothetical protein